MTRYQVSGESHGVFCAFQNPRRHAAAVEFPDRPGSGWSGPAAHPICACRAQARHHFPGDVGRKLVIISLVLLAICGFSPLANLLLYPLEARFPPWDATRGAPDGIVVLGGSIDPELSAAHGVTVFRGSVDRVIAAAGLAHRYPQTRI